MEKRTDSRAKMDYLSLVKAQPSGRDALILGERRYTFGMLAEKAEGLRRTGGERRLRVIREKRMDAQLIQFLAFCGTELIPVIVPWDMELSNSFQEADLPEQACMAAVTSGTTGKSKLLFRTFESWHSYFPIQNGIFRMGEGSRIFMQGSLAFTGNLNLCLAQLCFGGAVIAEETFDPRIWLREIEGSEADVIYLIPAKLRALKQACEKTERRLEKVRMLISGSQSLGGREAREYRVFFPRAELILYYGASELNYITYVRGKDMSEDKTLVGRPFPQVGVRTEDGEIRVTTDFGVIGTGEDSFIGDYGHFDQDGSLYFDGRRDDICNVNGRKISTVRIEQVLSEMDAIACAAVKSTELNGRDILAAWIAVKPEFRTDAAQIRRWLAGRLPAAEIPKRYIFISRFPVNESGKILKRALTLDGGKTIRHRKMIKKN